MDHHNHHIIGTTIAALTGADPLTIAGFVIILSFSFFASLHCMGMCLPLVCSALGRDAAVNRPSIWLYNLGRLVSYMAIGFSLGVFSQTMGGVSEKLSVALSITLGAVLIVFGVAMAAGKHMVPVMPSVLASMIGRAPMNARRLPIYVRDVGLGLVTGLLPCMTLTPAYVAAAATGNGLRGMLLMFAFFIGTTPVMIFGPTLPAASFGIDRGGNAPRYIASAFLLIGGVLTVMRGFGIGH